jgi:hypothetical protein
MICQQTYQFLFRHKKKIHNIFCRQQTTQWFSPFMSVKVNNISTIGKRY